MLYFYLFIIAVFIVGIVLTWPRRMEFRHFKPACLCPFVGMAIGLEMLAGRFGARIDGTGLIRHRGILTQDMILLHPDNARQEERLYRIRKKAYVLMTIFGGTLLALCMRLRDGQSEHSIEEYLERNAYGEGTKKETLYVQFDTENGSMEEEVTLSVGAQAYTQEEAYEWIDQAIAKLPELILGKNTTFDRVTENMELVKRVDDMPVSVEWISGNYRLMDNSGTITASELPEEGTVCMLTAKVSCEGYEKDCTLYVCLYPRELGYAEQIRKDLEEAVQRAEEENRTDAYLKLPETINGQDVVWIRKEKDSSVILLVLAIALAIGIWYAMDKDIHKRVLERQEQMSRDYPEFISKLVLYMGAGMTIRGAVSRIGAEIKKHPDRYIYEEIVRICHEMDSGISEGVAYLNFGKRCQDVHYVRLSMLLSQNLRKGNAGLISLLEKEAEEAFEERKRNARKYGEEAGTKLLLPMMLMLLIVMVVIMVPAFVSFGN